MKELKIMDLKVSRLFDRSKSDLRIDTTYTVTYEDLTYQIFDDEDLTETDRNRIIHFMKIADQITTVTVKRDVKRIRIIGTFFKLLNK